MGAFYNHNQPCMYNGVSYIFLYCLHFLYIFLLILKSIANYNKISYNLLMKHGQSKQSLQNK